MKKGTCDYIEYRRPGAQRPGDIPYEYILIVHVLSMSNRFILYSRKLYQVDIISGGNRTDDCH